ncbi:MAG: MBL fold metallo-hydrolase [Hyphomicrobiaceae bacterium]
MMLIDGWSLDILVQGFPGKSVCHGGLGWSTVVLLRRRDRVALIDCGTFSMRTLVINGLARHGLKPGDVTDLLLTHSHWDHSVNWPLFRHSRIVLGKVELDWALKEPWGETPVPELYVERLEKWPTLVTAADGDEVLPGVTAHIAPGHTPGCLVYMLHGREKNVVFTGDAAKNRAELLSRTTDMTYDPNVSRDTVEMIWGHWRKKPGSVIVPGHDLPMTQQDGQITYLGKREAAITCWYGEDMETTTYFNLTV